MKKKLFIPVLIIALLFSTGFYNYFDGGQAARRFMSSVVPAARTSSAVSEEVPHVISTAFPHHEQHEGNAFVACTSLTIGLNEFTGLIFTAPPTTRTAHLVAQVSSASETEFYLLKNPDLGVAGGEIPSVNLNSSSALSPLSSVSWVEGAMTGGDYWDLGVIGSGNQGGGSVGTRDERNAAAGSLACLSVVSRSADNTVFITIAWYEPDEEP